MEKLFIKLTRKFIDPLIKNNFSLCLCCPHALSYDRNTILSHFHFLSHVSALYPKMGKVKWSMIFDWVWLSQHKPLFKICWDLFPFKKKRVKYKLWIFNTLQLVFSNEYGISYRFSWNHFSWAHVNPRFLVANYSSSVRKKWQQCIWADIWKKMILT